MSQNPVANQIGVSTLTLIGLRKEYSGLRMEQVKKTGSQHPNWIKLEVKAIWAWGRKRGRQWSLAACPRLARDRQPAGSGK